MHLCFGYTKDTKSIRNTKTKKETYALAELKITANNFEKEALQSPLPVLLDFWAPWCGPCRMLAPELKALADEYAGRVVVGKVNVDEEPELAAAFRVSSIPTVVVIRDGKVVRTSVGYKPKEALAALLA